jgi:DNA uptake protein ComE-like DNA-binding protein
MLDNEQLKSWFGHSRRERRANALLLAIIVSVLLIRFMLPDRKTVIEEMALDGYDTVAAPISWSTGNAPDAGSEVHRADMKKPVITKHYALAAASAQDEPAGGEEQKSLLNLNSCDSAALVSLPGIGPVLSARIIRYRNMLGGFASVEQMKEVYGLPEETFNMIRKMVYADSAEVRKIHVNTADYRGLLRIPYIDKYEVTAIMKYRELKGSLNGIPDLLANGLVDSGKAGKIRPYLSFK